MCHFRRINREKKAVYMITDTWGKYCVKAALINICVLTMNHMIICTGSLLATNPQRNIT